MNSPVEERLRAALAEAGATIDSETLRPLPTPARRRTWMDARLLVVGVAVTAGVAATAVGLSLGSGDDQIAVAEPARIEPGKADMTIIMCSTSALVVKEPRCGGRDATAAQVSAVERAVRGLSQVEAAYTVDQQRAYDDFRADFAHNLPMLDAVKAADLPVSIRLTLKQGANHREVETSLRALPGIGGVTENTATEEVLESRTEALVNVFLCGKGSSLPSCGAERKPDGSMVVKEGKAATGAQKTALQKLIADLPGVQSITFEDQQAAYDNFKRAFVSNKALMKSTKVSDMPESFRVVLKQGSDWAAVVATLRRQPGVASAFYVPCQKDTMLALSRYGVRPPEDKVCSPGS
ncbi:permease-like cell division protein FtsX [Nonomuraea wenchangensis]|uniref:permease-like cell division protein FtsX n=1 Tax=Nonomuraea wenchangensis TaxID=568860 RepID=UPI0037125350